MTHFSSLATFTDTLKGAPGKGPLALILLEDEVEIESTLQHHLGLGFGQIIAFCTPEMPIPNTVADHIHRVDFDVSTQDAICTIVNAVIPAATGHWIYTCYNAEYVIYPFSEDRSVGEMLGFVTEERRDVVASYVIDLYAGDLVQHPNGVATDDAYFDKSGYYALARTDAEGETLDRQMNVFGGLRWRFEEHIATDRRRIDRISFFRCKPELVMLPDRTFNAPEYNTIACPWHNSLTAAVGSFRTAKALRRNPGSRQMIDSFRWRQSERFSWRAQQLLDLGLIEPGQWF